MKGQFASLGVLVQIAFRNLVAHRLKTLIVGGIIAFGALLVVVGSSMLDSVNDGMARSIQGSIAGHIQVYNSKSKESLSLLGNPGGQDSDLTVIDDYSKIKKTLEGVDNVAAVVPMGIGGALVTSGNTIDLTLARLRQNVNKEKSGDVSQHEQTESLKQHVRQMVTVLEEDLKKVRELANEKALDPDDVEAVRRATSDAFWSGFEADPYAALEFLENKIAPMVVDADLLFIRYLGTDFEAFRRSFDRMEIVDGKEVPNGKRGMLIPKFWYEEVLKLKIARRLDKIRNGLAERGKTIKGDAQLERYVKENTSQTKEIIYQLDGIKTREMTARLQKALGSQETDLAKLLSALLQTDDANFAERYKMFYAEVAPLVELYRIRVGDMFTIKAFTRTGYIQSVNVKVYGTYQFKGLEKSPLAGIISMIDLMSFRELYGYLSPEKSEELQKIRAAAGAEDVSRENAEAELFGPAGTEAASRNIVAEATPGVINALEEMKGTGQALRKEDLVERIYPKDEIERGVVLNAAVILKDPKRLEETIKAIEAAAKRDGLELTAISWQKASGLLGQFVIMLRIALYVAVLIIFIVALVIINNAMLMATLERVQEIGTLRAIGTQRSFIRRMLLVETLVVGALFGGVGAAVGAGIVKLIGSVGIPATSDQLYFFFSGPRLYPALGTTTLVAALVITMLVSALSAFYPAWIGMRVSPLQAMQTDE